MSRKFCFTALALITLLTAISLGGCGSGNKEGMSIGFTRISEAACAQCHGQAVSAVTGQSLYGGWQQASHFLLSVNPNDPFRGADQTARADCQRCHGGGNAHNGIGPIQFPKPDVAGICAQCHNAATFAAKAPQHVTSVSFLDINSNTVTSATYMDSISKCTNCHDPHDTKLTARFGTILDGIDPDTGMVGLYGDWAASGHGDTQGAPWTDEDFGSPKTGGGVCARCHSASGYKLYLANPHAGNWAWKTGIAANDTNKEVLRCDGCHTDYSFTRRVGATNGVAGAAGAALLPYSTTIPTGSLSGNKLSNAGDSNLCVNCHSGRQSGTFIATRASFGQLSSSSFGGFNSHYMAAAGILYDIIGYEGYQTSHSRYVPVGFLHNRIGLDLGLTIPATGASLGNNRGPCVGCHYTDPTTGAFFSHTLDAFVGTMGLTGTVTAPSVVCATCHVNGSSLQLQAADLNTLKSQYKAGLDAIDTLLSARYGITHNPAVYPYFSAATGSTIHWNTLAKAGGDTSAVRGDPGRHLVGAAFNDNLLTREPGAYAHNQQYSMTLIYDTIDYLEDGAVTGTLNGTSYVPLATLQAIFSVPVDGVTPVTARPIP
ncbi:MAG TPA: hypothetical protein VF799_04880 [Geobacteraceae bacterium]